MTTVVCALLSAIGFYFSLGLGDQWWLAWLAPIPVLWLAFGPTTGRQVFFASWAAMALGSTSVLQAYAGFLPPSVLILYIGAPSLLFAICVMGARRVQRAMGPMAAMFAFAALWTASDFLASFSPGGGSVGTPAAAEVGMPMLIQIASLVGFLGVTFLLGIVPAGISASLRTRNPLPAGLAVAMLAASAIYGYWRMSETPSGLLRVALVESDDTVGKFRKDDRTATLRAIDAYVAAMEKLRDARVQLIVLPENISRVAPEWRAEAQAKLAAVADRTHAILVAGFNTELERRQHNVSWAFTPGAAQPAVYQKRRLVPVVESAVFTPGPGPGVLPDGIGLEICKDMDYQAMLRSDEIATKPVVLAVPAWDFDKDDWSHARVAVLRSVENGVPMARSARNGLLTLNDRYGRLIARVRTGGDFTVVIGDLPIDGRGGNTVYDHIGDIAGWFCLLLGPGLVALSWVRATDPNVGIGTRR
jgi:apolipoprotein N-acyltransferase